MKIKLDGEELELPDMSPTPRVIIKGEQVYVFTYDYNYQSMPWLSASGTLRNASGAIILEEKNDN